MSCEQFSLIAKELRGENDPNYLTEIKKRLGFKGNINAITNSDTNVTTNNTNVTTNNNVNNTQKGGTNNTGIFRKQEGINNNNYVSIGTSVMSENDGSGSKILKKDFLKYFTDSSIRPNLRLTETENGRVSLNSDINYEDKSNTNILKTLNMINTSTETNPINLTDTEQINTGQINQTGQNGGNSLSDIYFHNNRNIRIVKNNDTKNNLLNNGQTIPKGHHIFRSRKIELDTSKDK
jgi:hypothetical protein